MTERYEILQSEVKSLELSLKSGRGDLAEWRKANVALFRARADLAADITEQIEIYEEMVDLLRTSEQATRQSIDAGQAPQTELRQARLATVEAQIALEQLRMARPQ
jgi:outer membrane protein TolC